MPAPVKVFSSRDFRTYRAATSPVAHIADRFFNFITSTSPESTHARYAYATAYLGHEPPPGTPFVGSELDYAVREMLEQPPVIVLAQGPMQPWGLFGPEYEAERQSIASSLSDGATVVEPVSSIFLPWSVHQALKDALSANDPEDTAAAKFFIMAGIIHETAHWIAANRHGYKPDAQRQRNLTSLIPKLNFGKAKIVQHTRKDWGTHAKELLLGFAYTFISYADGSHEVVCQRVAPLIPKLRPALAPEIQADIIQNNLPEIVDVSKYGVPALREPPKWRLNSDFLIVSSISPDAACHHGACRHRS